MKKHGIALVGCGGMAKNHASRFDALGDRLEITAVVDIAPEKAQAVSALLPNHPPVFTDYRDAFPLCEALLLVLPHHLHGKVTLDCLNAGKHVLVEKPMANSEDECLRMIAAAKRNNRVLMVAYCMRYYPLLREMRRLIREETYGKCFQLSIWTEQLTLAPAGSWFADRRTLGGGQLFSHGCHYIDLLLWMLGKPVWGVHFGSNYGTEWMDREGTSNVCLTFENGAMGYHFGTWGARGTKLGYAFHAHCEKGMLELNLAESRLYLRNQAIAHVPGQENAASGETVLMEVDKWLKPTVAEMAHFLDCIETGATPETSPEESLEGLRVIWKLYEAEENHSLADLHGIGF